jgi:hypothetical protein
MVVAEAPPPPPASLFPPEVAALPFPPFPPAYEAVTGATIADAAPPVPPPRFPPAAPPLAMTPMMDEEVPAFPGVPPFPTVTGIVDPGVTVSVALVKAPPPPPPQAFETDPPPPPAPHNCTVIEVTPAGTTKLPDASKVWDVCAYPIVIKNKLINSDMNFFLCKVFVSIIFFPPKSDYLVSNFLTSQK